MGTEPETELVESEVQEISQPDDIYLALFKTHGQHGTEWQVSGIIYREPGEVNMNLAAFNPSKILIVKVRIPKESKEA